MPQALVDTSQSDVARTVRPISTNLGVNPNWLQSPESPLVVPSYHGVQQITQMALMFTLWSRVEAYLYGECSLEPLASEKEENRQLGILRESETSVICMLCLLNNQPYSAGGLVDAMIGQHASGDQRGNARKRLVNRTLPVISDRYGLLQYQENRSGNTKEYAITRSERLAVFAEKHLAAGVEQIVGGEFTRVDESTGGEE